MVEARIRKEDPSLNFNVELPELSALSSIKQMVVKIQRGENSYYLTAEIHTLNGHRVFDQVSRRTPALPAQPNPTGEQLQRWFIELLRDTIRKRKKYQTRYHPKRTHLGDVL